MIPEKARSIPRFRLAIDPQSGAKVSPQFAWVPDSALATKVHGLSIAVSTFRFGKSPSAVDLAIDGTPPSNVPLSSFWKANLPAKRQAGAVPRVLKN
jgi:hypothetical protein